MTTTTTCPDCGTGIGEPHKKHCDIERCSVCGVQRIACDCEGHDQMQSKWTGEWPVGVETFDEGKKRWDQLIGLESTIDGGDLIYRSPTGFPLALANLHRFKGRFRATFCHPYGLQKDWLNQDEGIARARSVKEVNMSPSNDKVFVNGSEEEHREAIRSATYLLGAFGGLDNAREYLSQVSESLGHIPPRMPEGRQQWVALTREQFAADREEMFRRCTRMKGEGNAD